MFQVSGLPAWKKTIHLPIRTIRITSRSYLREKEFRLTRCHVCHEISINIYIRINYPMIHRFSFCYRCKRLDAISLKASLKEHRSKENLLHLIAPKRFWGIEPWYKWKPKANNNAKIMSREAFLFLRPRGLFSHVETCLVAGYIKRLFSSFFLVVWLCL